MTKPHRWADVIKAWADGQSIQVNEGKEWEYYDESCTPDFSDVYLIWRIAPTKKAFRVASMSMICSPSSHWLAIASNHSEALKEENSDCFGRWLTDWIEYE